MPRITVETMQAFARQLYDYELSDEAAASVARIVGAGANAFRRLESARLEGLQPPFGYANLIAEALNLRTKIMRS
jgi:hypothetical protein